MALELGHLGLYFDNEMWQAALAAKETQPTASAYALLTAAEGMVLRQRPTPTREDKHATTPVLRRAMSDAENALLGAYRWRFLGDEDGARAALAALKAGFGFEDTATLGQAIQAAISAAHMAELINDRDEFNAIYREWGKAYAERVEWLLSHPASPDAAAWQALLQMAGGITLEKPALVRAASQAGQQLIHTIHPEGYVRHVVESKDITTLARMLSMVAALVLLAEAGEHVGAGLWAYENRGVGVGTAVAYIVYYYYYPEKWRWAEGLTEELTRPLYAEAAPIFEIAAYRLALRGLAPMLDDLRPCFSLHYGGLTTLTHSLPRPAPKKRRWLW
jgi:hypothetical protein